VKYGPDEYLLRFAHQARVPLAEVPVVSAAITRALDSHLSPGLLESTLARMPVPVRDVVQGRRTDDAVAPVGSAIAGPTDGRSRYDDRIQALEVQITALTETVDALATGHVRPPTP
jgi:hypothetical protein